MNTISIISSTPLSFMLSLAAYAVNSISIITFIDPLIIYYGGYRYDQPNHLYHMLLICHAMAYFCYDSIIEIYYGTDDLLTNLHHIVVVVATSFFFFNKYGGFEYMGKIFLRSIYSPSFNGRNF